MIKLTSLSYKVKTDSLERIHKIQEHNNSILTEWEKQAERANSLDLEYVQKPFIEPIEFEDDDYDITEYKLRVRLKDIRSYKENKDKTVDIYLEGDVSYTLKESIEYIDLLFNNCVSD